MEFDCISRATDSVTGPSNEVYWIFGAIGADAARTTRSQVFGGIDSGDSDTFDSDEECLWGPQCVASELPEELAILIQLWEHDEGDPAKTQEGVAAAFAATEGVLTAFGVTAWVGAAVAGVGALATWLISYSQDDHIADQVFTLNRQTLGSIV